MQFTGVLHKFLQLQSTDERGVDQTEEVSDRCVNVSTAILLHATVLLLELHAMLAISQHRKLTSPYLFINPL